jgi:hypothetical protein
VSSTGALGPESVVGLLAGGGGGTSTSFSCPSGSVVTGWKVRYGTYVDNIVIHCRQWKAATRSFDGPTVVVGTLGPTGDSGRSATSACESPKQPASGIRGRASSLVDAVGLDCDEP